MPTLDRDQRRALVGDVTALLVLTIVGFATHLTLDAFGRMVVTATTALAAWALVSPFFGVYETETLHSPRALWRVGLAWLLAAPMATFLRGALLDRDIPPIFVIVVILTNGLGLLVWRIGFGWYLARRQRLSSMSTSNPL